MKNTVISLLIDLLFFAGVAGIIAGVYLVHGLGWSLITGGVLFSGFSIYAGKRVNLTT